MEYGYCILAVKLSLWAKNSCAAIFFGGTVQSCHDSAARRLGLGENFKRTLSPEILAFIHSCSVSCVGKLGKCFFRVWPNWISRCETVQSKFDTFWRHAHLIPNFELSDFLPACITLFKLRKLFCENSECTFFFASASRCYIENTAHYSTPVSIRYFLLWFTHHHSETDSAAREKKTVNMLQYFKHHENRRVLRFNNETWCVFCFAADVIFSVQWERYVNA